MPKFRYNSSGKSQRALGMSECDYDATGTVDAKDREDADQKVRAIKVGVKNRTHTVKVWPED